MEIVKEKLASILAEELGLSKEELIDEIEKPPKKAFGDVALKCFRIANKLGKKPNELAEEVSKIEFPDFFEKAQPAGAYVNFYISTPKLASVLLPEVISSAERYGACDIGKGKRVMIEYSQPNTNKPLHIGHLRNDSIGMAMSNIFEFCGYEVIRANLFNDRGIHICKAMLAYKLFGNNETPQSAGIKGDKLVGNYYVLFHEKVKEMPELEEKARELLRLWEQGDKKTRALWKKLRDWVIEGIKQTYETFGSKFDVFFYESEFYNKAQPIIEEGLAKGVFYRDESGAIVAKLEPELPNKVVLRADGTSIYITNDLALTKHKMENYKLDLNVFVVAAEQNLYFKQLFKIFELLGYEWYNKNEHLSYGLVLIEGGKLKSREGSVIDADDLIASVKELAKKEILKREHLQGKELEERALAIALAAIKFAMLSVDTAKDILFQPEKVVRFEGSTGPYVQYTYARARSILRKAKEKPANYEMLKEPEEKELLLKIAEFPSIVKDALTHRKPNFICNYLIELCELFNSFYHKHAVLNAEPKVRKARLALVEATSIVIKNALNLLNIPVLERM